MALNFFICSVWRQVREFEILKPYFEQYDDELKNGDVHNFVNSEYPIIVDKFV